ncbi:MAG: PepSY domain-containing protein [Saprospiraceae bacterium]
MDNNQSNKRHQQAKVIRNFRKIHRITGACMFFLFFFVSITGLLLGWKKNSGGFILPKTYQGTSTNLQDWKPLDSLHTIACKVLQDSISSNISTKLERIDIRKEKGMVKFVFATDYLGVQLDGATGKLLHIEKRWSDMIENIHDGSILDIYFNTNKGIFKLVYTTIMGLALLTFTITGFWLWYGPKLMRKSK